MCPHFALPIYYMNVPQRCLYIFIYFKVYLLDQFFIFQYVKRVTHFLVPFLLWKIPKCYREAHSTIVQLYLCPLACKLSAVSLLTDRTLLAPPPPILFASAIDLQKMALLNQHDLLQLFEILVLWAMNVRHILSLPVRLLSYWWNKWEIEIDTLRLILT